MLNASQQATQQASTVTFSCQAIILHLMSGVHWKLYVFMSIQ